MGAPRLVDPATYPRRYVTLQAAAAYLEVDRRTLHKYLDAQLLKCVTFRTRCRIAVADLVAFERRHRIRRRSE